MAQGSLWLVSIGKLITSVAMSVVEGTTLFAVVCSEVMIPLLPSAHFPKYALEKEQLAGF